MINIKDLLEIEHMSLHKSKYFSYCCIVKNGIAEVFSIEVWGKTFYIPRKLRKLTRHKKRFIIKNRINAEKE